MSFDSLLIHRATITRPPAADETDVDEYGQPVRTTEDVLLVACDIQPKSVRERAQFSQAGVTVGNWTMYMRPTDLNSADEIVHQAALCPVYPDHPDATFQVSGIRPIRDRTGIHHIEIDGELVESPLAVGS